MMAYSEATEPGDLRLAAVERNAELRRLIATAAIVICILLAIYAKIRGTQDESQSTDASADAIANQADPTPSIKPPVPAPAAKAATPPIAAPTKALPETKVTTTAALSSSGADGSKSESATASAVTDANGECQPRTGGEVKSWSPVYQRKSDARLYVISPKGGSVCVADASGKMKLIELKPMVGQAFGGKPPYTVRSNQLAQIEIYLQGFRAKIPPDTDTLKLIPTSQPAPVENNDSALSKEN
jgi:hypothetical protein